MQTLLKKWDFNEICKNPLQAKKEILAKFNMSSHEEKFLAKNKINQIEEIISRNIRIAAMVESL